MRCWPCFIIIVLAPLLAAPVASVSVNYDIAEDDGEAEAASARSQREVARLGDTVGGPLTETMRFVLQTVPGDSANVYFAVDARTGVLRTSNRSLDRDRLCLEVGQCCHGHQVCELQLRLKLIDSANYDNSQNIRVTVKLRDLNDNAPSFQHQRQYQLSIDENTPIGESFPLPQALDPDSEAFGVRSYELTDPTGHFQVSQVELNGRLEPRLTILKEIDREKSPGFNLTLIAKDGGSPPRSGELLVRVRVNDKNDETPRFDREQQAVPLHENFPVGRAFALMNATDPDEGLNAVIRYSLRDTAAGPLPSAVVAGSFGGPQFAVHPHTGAVSLLRPLDYERATSHVLVVEATDRDGQRRGSQTPRTGSATLTVSVLDINDEPPVITVSSPKEASDFSVDENAKSDTLVAWATVTDGDRPTLQFGRSQLVDCQLDGPGSDKFRLVIKHSEEREYEIRTAQPLDAEETPLLGLTISCSDKGEPPLTSVKRLQVRVNNLNDNRPTFNQRSLTLRVPENQGGSFFVHAFNATDRDGDRVTYSLEDTPDRFYFNLSSSGLLFSASSFDREQASQYHLKVTAKDRGEPPLVSEPLDVVVLVTDINDNAPNFRRSSFEFRVGEELEPGQVVGVIQADDPDSELNGQIRYSIAMYEARRNFDIHPTEGRITTVRKLDREAKSRHTFTVHAVDGGVPKRTATAHVTVLVADQNDNRPRFIYPGTANASVDTSYQNSVQTVIAEVQAMDLDEGQNSEILFSLAGGSGLGVFSMDAHTGRLSLARPLTRRDIGTYSLEVQARDGGVPPLATTAGLFVNVRDLPAESPPPPRPPRTDVGASGGGGLSMAPRQQGGGSGGGIGGVANVRQRNLVLIVCLVTLASLLAFAFLAIVVWLRRRPASSSGDGAAAVAVPAGRRNVGGSGDSVVKMDAIESGVGGSVAQPFKQHYPTLPLPQGSSFLQDASRDAGKIQTLKFGGGGGGGGGVSSGADANTYYRIPVSDENYEKNYVLSSLRQQQQQQQQQPQPQQQQAASAVLLGPPGGAYHGYQVLQPSPAMARHRGPVSGERDSLQVDRAGRDGTRHQQKSFNLVSSSFV